MRELAWRHLMLDLLLINPAAYRGNPRRGPYELATLLEQVSRAGYSAKLFDVQDAVGRGVFPFPIGHLNSVEQALVRLDSRIVLITFRTSGGPWALELARSYRQLYPESILIAFAPRIEERLHRFMERDDTFDALFIGRPEATILDLVANVSDKGGAGLEDTPGLLIRLPDGRLRRTKEPAGHIVLDQSPLVEPWISSDRSIAAIHVGRGCPDRCTFCAAHLGTGAQPRYLSAERVVREAEEAFRRLDPAHPRLVMLETENLTSNRVLIEDIGAERSRRGFQFQWGAYGRIDHIDETMRRLLRESGCCFLFMGLETGSKRLQKILGKNFDLATVIPRIRSLHCDGILTLSSFMFGIPGERYEDFVATAQLISDVVWAGGCIDWTPLRIEAGSGLERLVVSHPTKLLTGTELYLDLAEAGERPNEIDPEIGYRMYGLDLPHLDIDVAVAVAFAWRRLLINAPITTYTLKAGLNVEISVLLERLKLDPPETPQAFLQWALRICAETQPAASPFVSELASHELSMDRPTAEGPRYNIESLYPWMRRDPAITPRAFSLQWWGQP